MNTETAKPTVQSVEASIAALETLCADPDSFDRYSISAITGQAAALAANVAVERFAAMLRDPKQWVQNEFTQRISAELDAALAEPVVRGADVER